MLILRKSLRSSRGFTMIELVVVMALVGILTALAVPAFQKRIQDSAIRSTAEGLENGLRAASAEAVRRSQQVIFVLSAAPATFNGVPATVGNYWYIQAVPVLTSQTATAVDYYVQGSPASFSSNGTLITSTASAVICYNSLGRQVTNTGVGATWPGLPGACTAADTTFKITGATGTRTMWVQASLGGKVRMCDPNKTLSTTNPDGC